MRRVLHLMAQPGDEQSRRLSELLATAAAPAVVFERRTIGRAGTYRSIFDAVLRLPRDLGRFDVVHAWDAVSLSTVGWLGVPNVIASPFGKPPRLGAWERPSSVHWVCSTPYQHAVTGERLGMRDQCSLVEP